MSLDAIMHVCVLVYVCVSAVIHVLAQLARPPKAFGLLGNYKCILLFTPDFIIDF